MFNCPGGCETKFPVSKHFVPGSSHLDCKYPIKNKLGTYDNLQKKSAYLLS